MTSTARDSVCITVRGSTSNLGPGFDVIGLALDIPLHVRVTLSGCLPCAQPRDQDATNCAAEDEAEAATTLDVVYEGTGGESDAGEIPCQVGSNLLLRSAMTVAHRYNTSMMQARGRA